MDENLRTFLYPFLGILATCAFTSRFLIQWISSEKNKKTVVPRIFWKISIFGNITLALHYFIQVQYPFALVQALNAVLSWRNLNLMQETNRVKSLRRVIAYLILIGLIMTGAFVLQGVLSENNLSWMRIPNTPWCKHGHDPIGIEWHILGIIGALLFAGRFWVQWLCSELKQQSVLGSSFWWISIFGALLTLCYGFKIHDPVMIVSHSFGLVPYIRNLMLLRKT